MGFMQHLLTFMHVYQPGWFFRWSVIATQGIFMNTFFVVSESKAVVWVWVWLGGGGRRWGTHQRLSLFRLFGCSVLLSHVVIRPSFT